MSIQLIHFAAIMFLALLFAPAAAHAFALLNKINLSRQQYYDAQLAYRGWNLLGLFYIGALGSTLWLTIIAREQAPVAWLSGAALALTALTLVIFFIWVFPGNAATKNWTEAPENWQALRTRWECGHAANAMLLFVALAAETAAATVLQKGA
jgi:hypothetical protein